MSTIRKKLLLQKKRSLISKDLNNPPKHKKPSKEIITKGPWTLEEDRLLINWIDKNGPKNWTKCSQFIPGRSGKQCREHWNNSLNSEIVKGNWSSEEDFFIMLFYKKFNGSWKKMIPIFKSRTENSIKNRFYSQLRKITSKYIKTGKKEYSTKFGLDTLLNYFQIGLDEAKKKYLKNNPITEKELEEYVNKIENLVKNKNKGEKFIELDNLRKIYNKNLNNDIDINESEDEFNESLKKFSKKEQDSETIKKMKNNENNLNEENRKQTINPEDSKTYEETFEVVVKKDNTENINKPKIGEQVANIEEKNNINLKEKIKNECQRSNDFMNDKNNIYNINNNIFNINSTINYNINNNNNNNNYNNNYNNNNLYNKSYFNIGNIADNNSNISTNITNFNHINNLFGFNNQRNNSNIYNNSFNKFNNNFFLSKQSSNLSEHIKKNDHKAIENNEPKNISNQDVFQLLNAYNTPNYEYHNYNTGYMDHPNYYLNNNNYFSFSSGKINQTPNIDKKFIFPNDINNNYLSKRSDSLEMKMYQNTASNPYGFNKMASFNSIKDKNMDNDYTFDECKKF